MKQLQRVKTKNILRDEGAFLLRPDDKLQHIVGTFLPLLWQRPEGLLPVLLPTGMPKDEAEMDALVFSQETSYEDILAECLELLKLSTELNYFDIARMLELLEQNSPNYDLQTWARRFGMGEKQIRDCRVLNSYKLLWKEYFIQKKAALKRILHFSSAELRKELEFLLPMNPGINILENIALLLQEIAKREACDIRQCLQDCRSDEKEADTVQQIVQLRDCLYRRRYPAISAFENKMKKMLKDLEVPPGIKLETDLSAELPGLRLEIKAKDHKALQKALQWLDQNREKVEKILEARSSLFRDESLQDFYVHSKNDSHKSSIRQR